MSAETIGSDPKGAQMAKKKPKYSPEDIASLVDKVYGIPERHFRTDAHHIFGDNWRVNVWTNADDTGLVIRKKISYSYFINIDASSGDGQFTVR
jgi:hypothetical protein